MTTEPTFVAMGLYSWGIGPTLDAAKRSLRREAGSLSRGYIVYLFNGSDCVFERVDGRGNMHYTGEGKPVEVARRKPTRRVTP